MIHEFDPWFNFRATQYLADNGLKKFFTWFDYMAWYPLGRPVGTTIYPGMQITSVEIWRWLRWLSKKSIQKYHPFGTVRMSLNDVCVFVPAWFGSLASVALGLLAREVYGSWLAAGAAALVMSVIPAHIMRSVGGGYDNESVAMTAMCLTFWLWTRSLRTAGSWWVGAPAGLAYAYMVAAWGGFIFVGNMVAVHAAFLAMVGMYSDALWASYALFFTIGTAIAVQVPVVGWSPFKSMEQLGLLMVFLALSMLRLVEAWGRAQGLSWEKDWKKMVALRAKVAGAVAAALLVVALPLEYSGYFGGLSVRVRALFIKHTKTGNPLVDSVAEHQASSAEAYVHYLGGRPSVVLALFGLALVLYNGGVPTLFRFAGPRFARPGETFGVPAAKWFIVLYALIAYYFASRMQRLIILLGPVASVLGGVALYELAAWAIVQAPLVLAKSSGNVEWEALLDGEAPPAAASAAAVPPAAEEVKKEEKKGPAPSPPRSGKGAALPKKDAAPPVGGKAAKGGAGGAGELGDPFKDLRVAYKSHAGLAVRALVAALAMFMLVPQYGRRFYEFSDKFARDMSQPSIMFKAKLRDGQEVMINDYQEAYWWLRDNTPADARVLSWWDYGYQISGIANRTSLADGNTWNLEHIALLGRILTSPEKRAHSLARHLADYVLIWAGNQGDDLSKSPHMARIGSSVYPDICPKDPLCRNFGFFSDRKPTPSMAASMLYKMHRHNLEAGVTVNKKLFEDVYQSKYGLVRIFKILNVSQESRAWLANPDNRKCDRPGSWYCPVRFCAPLPCRARTPTSPLLTPPHTHHAPNTRQNPTLAGDLPARL